jgi:hypothetical protein
MDRLEHALTEAAVAVSHALDPVASGLKRLHFYLHSQMTFFNVPLGWHDGIIAAIWVGLLFMLFRMLVGWLRLVMLVCTLLVVAKLWGYLPA